jgi:hypothetical protein
MKLKPLLLFPIICAISLQLYSCNNVSGEKVKVQPIIKDQFFSPLHFHPTFFSNLSYPLWYQGKWIKEKKIQQITLRYFKTEKDSVGLNLPHQKRIYYFKEDGQLQRMHIYTFYDNKEIAEQVVVYYGNQENSGYQFCAKYLKPSQKPLLDTVYEAEFILPSLEIYKKIKSEKRFCTMVNMQTGVFKHLLYPEKFWGALSVDSILKPKANEIVVLGTAKKPVKIYSVKTKVIESNVLLIDYWDNSRVKKITEILDEYTTKTHFQYSNNGLYKGYLDSTFIDSHFIFNQLQEVTYTSEEVPKSVKLYQINATQQKKLIDRLTFTFTYYE